jgi:hypothetical protein
MKYFWSNLLISSPFLNSFTDEFLPLSTLRRDLLITITGLQRAVYPFLSE